MTRRKFRNADTEPLCCTGEIEPADSVKYFLEKLYESQRSMRSDRPNPFDAAFLLRRYPDAFGMLGGPCSRAAETSVAGMPSRLVNAEHGERYCNSNSNCTTTTAQQQLHNNNC
ncbi:MAG: hypothetical protein ABI120_16895, partial [Gemmatimonadaceae bacterium]